MSNETAMTQTQIEKKALETLEELGNARITDTSIKKEGTGYSLPETTTLKQDISHLVAYYEQQEEETSFQRTFKYRPWDMAAAVESGMLRVFGTAGIQQGIETMFGKNPPERIALEVGVNETRQVPWGEILVPMFEGTMHLYTTRDEELGQLGAIQITTKRKHERKVEGLFNVIDKELKEHSIYRGKAIDGQAKPSFLDLSKVDRKRVIYSEDTMEHLNANVWSLIEHADKMKELGLPLKRAALLEGPYGTGKTLAAFLTAQTCVAQENPWTFIMCRPGKDDIYDVLATARLYAPAVVFYEDVDTLSEGANNADRVSKLLDAFDGISSKGEDIMIIMTTNHKDRILKGMLRPGRLDAVIHIGPLDQVGITNMIKHNVKSELLDPSLDYTAIADAMRIGQFDTNGEPLAFLPAFAKEAIDRAQRYAIVRTNGNPTTLTTEDFVLAAKGLYEQFDLMTGAAERTKRDEFGQAFERSMLGALNGVVVHDSDGDYMGELVTETA